MNLSQKIKRWQGEALEMRLKVGNKVGKIIMKIKKAQQNLLSL
jgi:hypothetical protein